jgi:hypothetical protein
MKRIAIIATIAATLSACSTPEQTAETKEGVGLIAFTAAAILAGAAFGPF